MITKKLLIELAAEGLQARQQTNDAILSDLRKLYAQEIEREQAELNNTSQQENTQQPAQEQTVESAENATAKKKKASNN